MFTSTEHRPQALSPDCYTSQAQFDVEIERLFRPGWHCVGVTDEFPRDGHFKTLELLGRPLILWRCAGAYHTFLNVCAHRLALLTHNPCGDMTPLRCQYHGWEFDETGNTRRIPDARCFRPLAPGLLGLTKYRTEVCGPLIFVTLSADAPNLSEYLGDGLFHIRDWFTPDLHHCSAQRNFLAMNWKVGVENAIESYHAAEVHPHSLGVYPDEQDCRHEFHERGSKLTVDYSHERTFRRHLDAFGHWLVGAKPRYTYEHVLYLPNLMLARLSLFTWFESMLPIAPGKSLSLGHAYCNAGQRGRLLSPLRRWAIGRYGRRLVCRLAREDGAVLPDVQKGLEAGDLPKGGLISTREERISHFQEYILRTTDCPRWNPGTAPPDRSALALKMWECAG